MKYAAINVSVTYTCRVRQINMTPELSWQIRRSNSSSAPFPVARLIDQEARGISVTSNERDVFSSTMTIKALPINNGFEISCISLFSAAEASCRSATSILIVYGKAFYMAVGINI